MTASRVEGSEDGLTALIRDVLDSPDLVVDDDLGFGVVEEWDSFNHVNLMIAIETEFGVEWGPEEIGGLRTVGAIRAALAEKSGDGV